VCVVAGLNSRTSSIDRATMAFELPRIWKCGSDTTDSASSHSIRSPQDYSNLFVDELVRKNRETGRHRPPDSRPEQEWICRRLTLLCGFHWKSRSSANSIPSTPNGRRDAGEQLVRNSPAFCSFFSCGVARGSGAV
jgi:hypothetical protein